MLSILMPVYNERERVERAIAEVLETTLPTEFELIIVNDGSTDGTSEILRSGDWDGRVRLFEHEVNQGKGAAVQTALREARGEFAAIFDADLEYDPGDLALLMPPLLDGRSNACFGVRAFDGYTSHSFLFVLGNKGVTLACNVLFNVYLHDIMTCHKMIRTDLFRSLAAALARVRDRARDHGPAGPARRADLRSPRPLPGPRPTTRARSSPPSTASARWLPSCAAGSRGRSCNQVAEPSSHDRL